MKQGIFIFSLWRIKFKGNIIFFNNSGLFNEKNVYSDSQHKVKINSTYETGFEKETRLLVLLVLTSIKAKK